MRRIRYGCQTYPWKLNPERYTGEMDHIARVTAEAGLEAWRPKWSCWVTGFGMTRKN